MSYKMFLSTAFAIVPVVSFALPKMQTTTLPLPVNQQMAQQDKQAIDFVVGMPVYQDNSDSKQFYYIPKLQASVNADGVSATYIKNENQLRIVN